MIAELLRDLRRAPYGSYGWFVALEALLVALAERTGELA